MAIIIGIICLLCVVYAIQGAAYIVLRVCVGVKECLYPESHDVPHDTSPVIGPSGEEGVDYWCDGTGRRYYWWE